MIRIIEITENKKAYLDLLLLADEQEDMIDRYLERGRMYVLDDDGVKSECVITDEGNGVLEIKNLATLPEHQHKGYAKALISFLVKEFSSRYSVLQVGTGDSPLTVPFFHSLGQAGKSSMSVTSLLRDDCISISQTPPVPPKLPSIWKGGWASKRLG